MSVVFEAKIKSNGDGPHDWFIQLTDTGINNYLRCLKKIQL